MRWVLSGLVPVLLPACGGDGGDVARGWVEGREVVVAPMSSGRLVTVRFEEGDTVAVGDTVALLTRAEVPAELAAARSRAEAAQARLAELERGSRSEDVAAARAELSAAEADLANRVRTAGRLEALEAGEGVSQQELDEARTAVAAARGRRDVAREAVARLVRGARPEQLEAARAEADAAAAAWASARAAAGELTLLSPVSGPVLLRTAEPGEVVAAGRPVLTVLVDDERWVRVWVSQARLTDVRVGSTARVGLDALPDTSFRATVASVATRAEFTPRVALTEEERADLMYAVRLRLDDAAPALRVGLPVDVRFGEAAGDE